MKELSKILLRDRAIDSYIQENTSISKADIEKLITNAYRTRKERLPRKIVISRYCKTHGIITDDGTLNNHCSDPECVICSEFHRLLAEEAKTFLKDG